MINSESYFNITIYGLYFQFNRRRTIQEDSDFFRKKPTISDKMHCVLFVVNAFTLDRQADFRVLRWMQHYFFSKSKCKSKL